MKGGSRRFANQRRRMAFSLVELVIVVTILGILASIAIPRMTTAAAGAQNSALEATLANTRKAIDVFYAEHGRYPGFNPTTGLPDDAFFQDQLLLYSDETGKTNPLPTSVYIYGPYLRAPFPTNPFNRLDTVKVKATPADADPVAGTFGWVAVLSHGYFGISASDAVLNDAGFTGIRAKAILRN